MDDYMKDFEAVIGLEVHAQLLTQSKMFCGCRALANISPNKQTCPICTGLPGSLPSTNQKAIEFAAMAALALHCSVEKQSIFARKNYFYPDLPKGYQISQYDRPFAKNGYLELENGKKVRIQRLHLEEDAGKLVHAENISLVDFNRAGIPLIEIVSEPDLRNPEEASEYLRKLRAILMELEICDGNMQEGSLRCDANISMRRSGEVTLGTKAEIKNMNSFKFLEAALIFEIKRQSELISQKKKIIQETRLWDDKLWESRSMRTKEEAHDYRYFPEPDLLPLDVDPNWVQSILQKLPELPDQKKLRFMKEYDLPEYDADLLVADKALATYFERTLSPLVAPKKVSNWVLTELLALLKKEGLAIEESPVSPEVLNELLALIEGDKISGKMGKEIFLEMFKTPGKKAQTIIQEKGLARLSDPAAITSLIEKILHEFPNQVAEYQAGREKLFGFFVGKIMQESRGQADPRLANEILREKLKLQH